MSDSVWPPRWQPTRLPHPWDSPGKNTGMGCHFLLQNMTYRYFYLICVVFKKTSFWNSYKYLKMEISNTNSEFLAFLGKLNNLKYWFCIRAEIKSLLSPLCCIYSFQCAWVLHFSLWYIVKRLSELISWYFFWFYNLNILELEFNFSL